MRLVTVRTAAGPRAARVEGEHAFLLASTDVGALLAQDGWRSWAATGGERVDLAGLELEAVVPAPEKIICSGLNYRTHAAEAGHPIPGHPTFFAKYMRALIGPHDDVVLPRESDEVDWEAELTIVIGSTVRRADEAEAAAAIGGYTVMNDISMRDWQRRTPEWLQGKTFEDSTPLGPVFVSSDEFDALDDPRVTCTVGDDVVQDAAVSDLIFSPAELVAYASLFITLVPGDLIATGTPAGVGGARKPPRFLAPGDVVRTSVSGIGELRNVCVADDREGA